jgi:anti-sigma factor RsiW
MKADHLAIDALLDYWLGDADAAATDAVDEHLMRCDACGEALDGLIALGDCVREALRDGALAVVTGRAFVDRLAARGLRVREYRVPRNGSVNCAVAPEDELLVSRLEVPLQGVQRLDALMQDSTAPDVQHRLHDIAFDPQAGEVFHLPKLAELRRLPAHTAQVTLLAVEPGGTREVGRYTFHHRPWPGQ